MDRSGHKAGRITTLAFVSTHLHALDQRLIRRYAQSLAADGHLEASLWVCLRLSTIVDADVREPAAQVMLYQKESHPPDGTALDGWQSLPVDVWPWSPGALTALFPRLGQAADQHELEGTAERDPEYLKLYWYFHAALMLWWAGLGHAYHRAKFVWRLEMDAIPCSSGSIDLARLVSRTAALTSADVLLPRIRLTSKSPLYTRHVVHNMHLLKDVPNKKRVWSLVCLGRFSVDFLLRVMAPRWGSGTIAYEEIFLPVACLMDARCTLASLASPEIRDARAQSVAYLSDVTSQAAWARSKHVRFRPAWRCSDFMRQCENSSADFFHPVKDADCVFSGEESPMAVRSGLSGSRRKRRLELRLGSPRGRRGRMT